MSKYTDDQIKDIDDKYLEMIEKIKPNMDINQLSLIHKAYQIALNTFDGIYLYSNNKPFLFLLIEVAKISVLEIGLSAPSIISIFLYNVDLEKDISINEIKETFGNNVSTIVSGFKKVSGLDTERLSYQSENFRKLFLSLIDDIRVVLIFIALKLYELRNEEDIDPINFKLSIYEVKHFYIPITHRLGLYIIKAELEEEVMIYENPKEFQLIKEYIKATKTKQEVLMKEFIAPIERELIAQGFDGYIKWRTKSIPSIYTKMREQNVEIENVFDIFAIRIIITNSSLKSEKEDCWRVYSIVTNLYEPDPKRLRDWITTPKASGYESLHTTVKANTGRWVEVQIRTARMDEVAEKGQAAHWQYKEKNQKQTSEEWLTQIRNILEHPEQIPALNTAKYANKHQSDKIFIFTPGGDLKQLPIGSTVLDFAYEVHTKVGETCSGAQVNGKNVPIRHILKNGDKVKINTNKNQTPKADWLNFVTSVKAKTRIKRYLKEEVLKEAELGRGILLRKFKNWKINHTDLIISSLIKEFKTTDSIELYHKIATEQIDIAEVKRFIFSQNEEDKAAKDDKPEDIQESKKAVQQTDNEDFLVIDNDLSNVNYNLAKCCKPIAGDDVFGFVTIGQGISIHRKNCPNAVRLREKYSYRLIHVKWKEAAAGLTSYLATLHISGKDSLGLVDEITTVISKDLKINMRNISFSEKDGNVDGKITVQISSEQHLDRLISRLEKIRGIKVQKIE